MTAGASPTAPTTPVNNKPFSGSWWLPGGHAQTLWPTFMRRVPIATRTQRLELADGDFVRLDWVGETDATAQPNGKPIVIVMPGLQGTIKSSYVRRILRACEMLGWRGVLLNHRGCGEPNRLPQSYHCGHTRDLAELVEGLKQREPDTAVAVVGFSLGANILLKWLGECGERGQVPPLVAAVGVSVPFHLGRVAQRIERGFSRLYQWYLLKSLRRDMREKFKVHDIGEGLAPEELPRLNTFHKFDTRVTAPMHGFAGAEDYYARTRSDLLLRHVNVPTLIINAKNDPMIPSDLIPDQRDVSTNVTLEITRRGGHMGYVCGRWPWSASSWLDTRVPGFLAQFLRPAMV